MFADKSDEYGLSKEAYYFMGGLMKHISGIAAITNPLVNSYKRLTPGYGAPIYVAWSAKNRSPLIRIPLTGDGIDARIRQPIRTWHLLSAWQQDLTVSNRKSFRRPRWTAIFPI